MHSRWFEVAVVLLWVATMSWLVSQKIVPPILTGQPPNYRTIVKARQLEPPVGWTMHCNNRSIGWALSSTVSLPHDLTEIRSRVHLARLPLEEVAPGWLGEMFSQLDEPRIKLALDVKSTITIDPLGRLSYFDSAVELKPLDQKIKIDGTVRGPNLVLSVRSADVAYTREVPINSNALLGDSFSPETKLPGLKLGQTWKVRSVSPLAPQSNPVELLEATVERIEPLIWNGRTLDARIVIYRSAHGLGLTRSRGHRGKIWVDADGTVLQQEVMVFNAKFTFVRMPREMADKLAEKVAEEEPADGNAR